MYGQVAIGAKQTPYIDCFSTNDTWLSICNFSYTDAVIKLQPIIKQLARTAQ